MKEINVDLLPLIRKLEAVLKRGFSRDLMVGSYRSVYRGKGLEFVGFRDYDSNDDALLIDWMASLRAHKPLVRQLEEERDITIYFLLDVSDKMLFSSHKKLKCEYAAELVGTLSYAMNQVGDNVGLGMFNDRVVKYVLPATGRNQFYKIVRSLTNPSLYGGKFDIANAINYVFSLKFLKQDSVLFLVSDFINLKPGWEYTIKLAGLKYDLTAIVVRDPVDMRMPLIKGEVRLGDPFSNDAMIINPNDLSARYEAEARSQIERLRKELNKTDSSLLVLETDKDFTGEILKFFRMRQQKFKR